MAFWKAEAKQIIIFNFNKISRGNRSKKKDTILDNNSIIISQIIGQINICISIIIISIIISFLCYYIYENPRKLYLFSLTPLARNALYKTPETGHLRGTHTSPGAVRFFFARLCEHSQGLVNSEHRRVEADYRWTVSLARSSVPRVAFFFAKMSE